jgi:hypothetical protein
VLWSKTKVHVEAMMMMMLFLEYGGLSLQEAAPKLTNHGIPQ